MADEDTTQTTTTTKDTTSADTTAKDNTNTDTTTKDEDDLEWTDDGKGPESDADTTQTITQTIPTKKNDDIDPDDIDGEDARIQARVDAAVQKAVAEKTQSLTQVQEKSRVDNEWGKLKADYPELTKIEAKALRFAQHKKYEGKPVIQAVLDVAGPDIFVKIGAARGRKADKEAQESRGGGGNGAGATSTSTHETGVPSFKGKSPTEIAQIKRDFARGKYNK